MLNYTKWFSNQYKKSDIFRLNYNELLTSSHLTPKNLEDFNNPNYCLTKLDIFKYIIVLEWLFKNNEHSLAYNLNPYLMNKFNTTNKLLAYNEILEVNIYKNIIIDLFFLNIPELAHKSIPLDILLGQVSCKTQLTPYSEELTELKKMGYGFEYFGKKSMSLFIMLYFKAFYKNITLYSYKEQYLSLSKLLMEYTIDKIHDFSEISRYNTFLSNKIKNYSSFMNKWDDLDTKGLDISTKILKDVLEEGTIKQLHFECKDFTSPLDIKELDSSYLTEYCLLYYLENPESESMVDEGIEMSLEEIIDSNLNSKFLTSLIISNTPEND